MTTVRSEAPSVTVPGAPAIPGLRFRHVTDDDWDAMAALLTSTRRGDGVDEIRDGESLRGEYGHLEPLVPGRDFLLAEVGEEAVALVMGILVPREGALVAETWGIVLQAWRHRGIGRAMWEWNRVRLTEQASADPTPGPRELRTYALDIEESDIGFLEAQGYVPVRFGFEMRRFLTGTLPDHPVPAGLELRPVAADEHRRIWEADDEAFRDHWGHREQTDADFVARFAAPETEPALWSVAWDGDEVAGSVMTAIYRDENRELGIRRGWLEHVSVRRPWRGRGLAKALCCDAFRVLREHGIDEAWLGVDGANPTGALALYEGLGFSVVRRWRAFGRPLDRPAPPGWMSGSASDL